MALPYVIPIGPLLSLLGAWFGRLREKVNRDSRLPYLKTEPKPFGFSDADKLPAPENEAVLLSMAKIADNDFEAAKHILVNAWLLMPADQESEMAFLRLREGFANLYLAKGDRARAETIATMPTMLLDREVQWIVTHPHDQIGGSAVGSREEPTDQRK
jgi:hypothetical protein